MTQHPRFQPEFVVNRDFAAEPLMQFADFDIDDGDVATFISQVVDLASAARP